MTLDSLKDRYNGATYHERHQMIKNASQVAMKAMGDWRDGLITVAQRESRRAAYFALLELRNNIEKE